MLAVLQSIFMPLFGIASSLHLIAKELVIMRELYEADLMSRDVPVMRITQKPRESDTEVSYMGENDGLPKHKQWFPWNPGRDDAEY